MQDELTLRTRLLKAAVAMLVLALFLPGLFQLVLTVSVFCMLALLGSLYYFNVQPYAAKIDVVFAHIGELIGSVSHESVIVARQRLNQNLQKEARRLKH